MTIHLKHEFTVLKPDGADNTVVRPSNWNAEHVLSTAAGKLLGSDSSGPTTVQELPGSFDTNGNFTLTAALGFFLGAKGTTGQRPGSPQTGMVRYNTTTGKMEFYDGGWQNCATEDYVDTAIAAAASVSTGDVKFTIKNVADAGWLMFADQTIGSSTSGATYANADAEDLFLLLWNRVSDTYAPVSTGRGGSAAADWAANKNIKLLTTLGRFLGFAGAGSGLTSRALGSTIGAEEHTITNAELPFTQPGSTANSDGGSVIGVTAQAATPMSIMNPGVYLNCMIKL